MKYLIIWTIKFYQLTFGVFVKGSCRFHPTCSEYMKTAVLKHGIFKGVFLGVRRLTKCHPYSKHFGIDEV
tara:strand:+ start:7302 stop:7511 length:210 start_codon:yes stop_codon:yes gene_type:complete